MAVQALAILPALFPSAPVDPLATLTPAPTRTEHTFLYAAGTVDATMFRPAGPGRHGAVVMVLGVGPLPLSGLADRFAEALAREGVVVLIPQSSALLAERVLPQEADAFAKSLELLVSQADVDATRIGFIGLSAAGGLSIVAAAQPALRDRVRFVNSLGGYYDATTLLVDVASRSIEVDGEVRPWQPEQRTQDVLAIALVDTLPTGPDQAVLSRAFVDHAEVPEVDWRGLSPEATNVRTLLVGGVSREAARASVVALSAAARDRLRAISPSSSLSDVRAHLYLMHDTDDAFIPFTQTRALVAAARPGLVVRTTELSILEHVIPDRPVPWQTFLPDLWALYWHVHAVLLELL